MNTSDDGDTGRPAPKRGERLQLMLTLEESEAVDTWRFERRMPSRSAAVRALMKLGFAASADAPEAEIGARGVASEQVGVLNAPPRIDAALSGGTRPRRALLLGRASLELHGLRAVLSDSGWDAGRPLESAEDAREALRRRGRPEAAILDPKGADAALAAVAAELAEDGTGLVICAADDGALPADWPDSLRRASLVSHASAVATLPDSLARAAADAGAGAEASAGGGGRRSAGAAATGDTGNGAAAGRPPPKPDAQRGGTAG